MRYFEFSSTSESEPEIQAPPPVKKSGWKKRPSTTSEGNKITNKPSEAKKRKLSAEGASYLVSLSMDSSPEPEVPSFHEVHGRGALNNSSKYNIKGGSGWQSRLNKVKGKAMKRGSIKENNKDPYKMDSNKEVKNQSKNTSKPSLRNKSKICYAEKSMNDSDILVEEEEAQYEEDAGEVSESIRKTFAKERIPLPPIGTVKKALQKIMPAGDKSPKVINKAKLTEQKVLPTGDKAPKVTKTKLGSEPTKVKVTSIGSKKNSPICGVSNNWRRSVSPEICRDADDKGPVNSPYRNFPIREPTVLEKGLYLQYVFFLVTKTCFLVNLNVDASQVTIEPLSQSTPKTRRQNTPNQPKTIPIPFAPESRIRTKQLKVALNRLDVESLMTGNINQPIRKETKSIGTMTVKPTLVDRQTAVDRAVQSTIDHNSCFCQNIKALMREVMIDTVKQIIGSWADSFANNDL